MNRGISEWWNRIKSTSSVISASWLNGATIWIVCSYCFTQNGQITVWVSKKGTLAKRFNLKCGVWRHRKIGRCSLHPLNLCNSRKINMSRLAKHTLNCIKAFYGLLLVFLVTRKKGKIQNFGVGKNYSNTYFVFTCMQESVRELSAIIYPLVLSTGQGQ